jgi:hypothetical protein
MSPFALPEDLCGFRSGGLFKVDTVFQPLAVVTVWIILVHSEPELPSIF